MNSQLKRKMQNQLNKMVKYLKTMNSQCTGGPYDACLYRSNEPGKPKACLIGHLIPDSKYDPKMDSCVTSNIDDNKLVQKVLGMPTNKQDKREYLEFLTACQRAHDLVDDKLTGRNFRRAVMRNLRNTAEVFELKIEPGTTV